MPNKPGPRTPSGKAAVRHNAITHGLRTADIIMPGEFRLVWRRFHDAVVHELAPGTPIERELASHIASLMWRLRRVPRAEAALVLPRILEQDPLVTAFARSMDALAQQLLPPPVGEPHDHGDVDSAHSGDAATPQPNPGADPIITLMTPVHQALDHIVRYEAHLTRQLYAAMSYLAALRNARLRAAAIDPSE